MGDFVLLITAIASGYAYIGFPLLLAARANLKPKPYVPADIAPAVTLIIAAHNEASVIEQKLINTTALAYPAERLEVIVASDGSTDGTNRIVRRWAGNNIKLVELPRGGKAAALNAAAKRAQGEILVFTDANSSLESNALLALIRPFGDSAVGGVAGLQRYSAGTSNSFGERWYWSVESRLKCWESRGGNTISATGALYAIRRELYSPIPPGVNDDFVASTRVIERGYRLVFEPTAVAVEPPADSFEKEFARKVRVGSRMVRSEWYMRGLTHPRFGFYAVQYVSHKPLRRLLVFPFIASGVVVALRWNRGGIYRTLAITEYGVLALAAVGFQGSSSISRLRVATLCAHVCLTYAAQVVAYANLIRGRSVDRW